MEVSLFNQFAKKVGAVVLSDSIFGLPINKDLLYQVVTSQMANKRQNIAHTKERGEVRGGGKKPWRQKGTGRARHGSIRSPIWKGGGVTFGPRSERNFKKKINKKMARKALFISLSSKVKDMELVVVDDIKLENWKTKEMARVLDQILKVFPTGHGSLLIVTGHKLGDTIERVTGNLPRIDVMEARNLNALDVMARKNILLMKDAVEAISKTFTKL